MVLCVEREEPDPERLDRPHPEELADLSRPIRNPDGPTTTSETAPPPCLYRGWTCWRGSLIGQSHAAAPPSRVHQIPQADRCRDAAGTGPAPDRRQLTATHKHPKVQAWLRRYERFHFHFIPTSSSWLNLVRAAWFRRDHRQAHPSRRVFQSVEQLIEAIRAYIEEHNQSPQPFIWTAKAENILEKVRRARAVLDKIASE